jgi:cytochrome c556
MRINTKNFFTLFLLTLFMGMGTISYGQNAPKNAESKAAFMKEISALSSEMQNAIAKNFPNFTEKQLDGLRAIARIAEKAKKNPNPLPYSNVEEKKEWLKKNPKVGLSGK